MAFPAAISVTQPYGAALLQAFITPRKFEHGRNFEQHCEPGISNTSFANIETWALYLTSLYLKSAIIKTQPYQQYTSNTVQHRKTATLIRKASYKTSYWYSRLCVYYLLAATTHCGQPKKRKRRSTMKKVILEHLSAQHHAMMLHTSK